MTEQEQQDMRHYAQKVLDAPHSLYSRRYQAQRSLKALDEITSLQAEVDALRKERDNLKAAACSPCGLCLSHGCAGPSTEHDPRSRPGVPGAGQVFEANREDKP